MSATEQQQERRVYAKPNGVGGVEVSMRDPRFAALPTAQVQLNGQQAFEFADEILTALDAGGQAHELIIRVMQALGVTTAMTTDGSGIIL